MLHQMLVVASDDLTLAALETVCSLFVNGRRLPYRIRAFKCSTVDELTDHLDRAFSPRELFDLLAVVCMREAKPESLFELQNFGSDRMLEHSAAELLLGYPEVMWQFVWDSELVRVDARIVAHSVPMTLVASEKDQSQHGLERAIRAHLCGRRDWFDPSGARAKVRATLHKKRRTQMPLSKWVAERAVAPLAWVLEDEPAYAASNGYALYRFGYRVDLISTNARLIQSMYETAPNEEARKKLNSDEGGQPEVLKGVPQLLLEKVPQWILADWDLSYPDLDDKDANQTTAGFILLGDSGDWIRDWIKEPVERRELGKKEPVSKVRLAFVSAAEKSDASQAFVGPLKRLPEICREAFDDLPFIPKPVGGVFDLAAALGLEKWVEGQGTDARRDYLSSGQPGNHSNPNAVLHMADRMLQRAMRLRADSLNSTLITQVLIAWLAGEAKELLGGRTRSLSGQALVTQLEAEQRAALLTFGVAGGEAANRLIKQAFADVDRLVGIDTPLGSNLYMGLLRTFHRQYVEFAQVECADACQRESSKRELKSLWRKPNTSATEIAEQLKSAWQHLAYRRIAYFPRLYLDFITRGGTSFARLAMVSLGWMLLFAAFYSQVIRPELMDVAGGSDSGRYSIAFFHSAATFIQFSGGLTAVDDAVKNQLKTSPKGGVYEPTVWPICSLCSKAGWDMWPADTPPRIWCYFWGQFIESIVALLHIGLFVSFAYRYVRRSAQ